MKNRGQGGGKLLASQGLERNGRVVFSFITHAYTFVKQGGTEKVLEHGVVQPVAFMNIYSYMPAMAYCLIFMALVIFFLYRVYFSLSCIKISYVGPMHSSIVFD